MGFPRREPMSAYNLSQLFGELIKDMITSADCQYDCTANPILGKLT